jgi:hypothetical protein
MMSFKPGMFHLKKEPIFVYIFAFFYVVLFCQTSKSASILNSDISSIDFDSTENPYIFENEIVIPKDKEVRIKEGCVLLFKPFTQLTIHGSLIVEGTAQHPVIFSSVYEKKYNPDSKQLPNAFDWNGIVVNEAGKINFKNFEIKYSVFGIRSQTYRAYLTNGIFSNNGQFNFTINDEIQDVVNNIPYTNGLADERIATTLSISTKPSGAAIFLNGQSTKYTTPATILNLKPGLYTIYVQKDNLEAFEEIKLVNNNFNSISIALLKKYKRELQITTNPPGANIYLNKRITPRAHTAGVSPKSFALDEEVVSVSLFKENYRDTVFNVQLKTVPKFQKVITMIPMTSQEQQWQKKFTKEKQLAKIGKFSVAGGTLFILGGVAGILLAKEDYAKAETHQNQLLLSGNRKTPEYLQHKQNYYDATEKGIIKRNGSFFLIGIGAAVSALGIYFYF